MATTPPLQLDDLEALDAPALKESGRPLLLPVDCIDEDPDQPRHEFDANALAELAETIRERGVRQPISVRPDLGQAGRWVLNFGARRLRATKLARLTEIPAFVDTSADDYDQVIENEQREGLKPLELALFVQKRLAHGDSRSKIASRLGKSRQYVTLATAMIEPPDWLLELYRQGRCRGMAELYELRRLHGEHPEKIEAWTTTQTSISRNRVDELRAQLSCAVEGSNENEGAVEARVDGPTLDASPVRSEVPATREPRRQQQSNSRIHVEMDGQDYQLVVSVVPQKDGHVYVRPLAGGPRLIAPAAALKLRGFVGR